MDMLTGVGVLLFAAGAAVIWKQSGAKQCPLHNRYAGYVATWIGASAMITGITVLALACWWT